VQENPGGQDAAIQWPCSTAPAADAITVGPWLT